MRNFVVFAILLQQSFTTAFLPCSTTSSCQRISPLYFAEDLPLVGEECGEESTTSMLESLKKRQKELEHGVGKRYICRTRKGFLNVHKEPCEPFNPYNIVNQLSEGDIVTSVSPPRGGWIHHDSGWSVAVYNGHTWLVEVNE